MEENQNLEDLNQVNNEQVQSAPAEKTFTQSDVNALIGKVKAETAQKERRRAEEEYQRNLEQLNAQKGQADNQGTQQIDAEAIYQQVQERMNQQRMLENQEREVQQIAQSYLSHVDNGRKAYEDFDEVTKDFDAVEFPHIVALVAGIENAGDVIYEIAKNPSKLVTIDNLARRSPRMAQAELMKLAASIATNKQAKAEAEGLNVNSPLERIQPSRVSSSNDDMSISDLRNQDWLWG